MSVLIVMPVHNDLDSFRATVESIQRSTISDYTLLIIESESTDGSSQLSDWLARTKDNIEVIHTPKEGPLVAYNLGFQEAINRKMDLFMSQTDVIYPKLYKRDWLEMLSEAAKHHGCVATCINGGGTSGPSYVDGLPWLGGWCTYVPYKILKDVGLFDKNFPNGYGVDIDWSYRLSQKGYGVFKINYWVDHHMMNSREHDNNPNTEQMKQDAAKYFKVKHELD